jgi:putative DNA primase/helicase
VEGAETGFAVVASYRNKVEVRCMRNCGSLEQADIEWSDYDHIIIYADRDKVDPKRGYRPGEHSADILATRLRQLGKRVSIPKAVVEGTDFRDVWELQYRKRQERHAAFEERRKLRNEVRERNRAQLRTSEHRSAA